MTQDFKVTTFDASYSQRLASGDTILGGSSGSNAGYLGGDVVGGPGGVTVVGLSSQVALASNINGALGDVLTIISTSPRTATFATPSNSQSSNSMLRTTGGFGRVITVAASGSAYTVQVGAGVTWDITLTANCTISFTGAATTGWESSVLLIIRENGTGGWTPTLSGVTWAAGTPTWTTTASTSTFVMLETVDGGGTWVAFLVGGSSGTTSPLTTKGDLYTYSTTNARLAIGSNGTGLIADSAELTGNRWTLQALSGELLMADGVTGPPVPIESDPAQNDWLYADL